MSTNRRTLATIAIGLMIASTVVPATAVAQPRTDYDVAPLENVQTGPCVGVEPLLECLKEFADAAEKCGEEVVDFVFNGDNIRCVYYDL